MQRGLSQDARGPCCLSRSCKPWQLLSTCVGMLHGDTKQQCAQHGVWEAHAAQSLAARPAAMERCWTASWSIAAFYAAVSEQRRQCQYMMCFCSAAVTAAGGMLSGDALQERGGTCSRIS